MNHLVIGIGGTVLTVAFTIWGAWFTLHVDPKIKARGYLLMAAGGAANTVQCLLVGPRTLAYVMAGVTAFHLYMWWNNGGGDGMRKAWKKLRSISFGRSPLGQGT